MDAWGTILQRKAKVELGWWIIDFPFVYPGSSFHWVNFGTKRTIMSLLEICCAPLPAEILELPMQREAMQAKVFLRGNHIGKIKEQLAVVSKGSLGLLGLHPLHQTVLATAWLLSWPPALAIVQENTLASVSMVSQTLWLWFLKHLL